GHCADCEHGKLSGISGDVICKYEGIVSPSSCCKKYKKNLLAARPPKKRNIAGNFNPDDFSIN
ncbi:MAG: hypothetical protein Q8873_05180, partial [Bacillota bacterium]|nr:hypothetical protein [Bacillota bacterium]